MVRLLHDWPTVMHPHTWQVPTWAIAGPITSLLLAYGLAFVPMGARLIVQIASGHTDNVRSRRVCSMKVGSD